MTIDYEAQLMSYLDRLVTTIEAGASWTIEQLPDVAHQGIVYNMWKSGLLALLCLSAVIFLWVGWYKIVKKSDDYGNIVVLTIIAGFSSIGLGAGFFTQTNTFLLCTLAPKVFLIQTLFEIAGHPVK